MIRIFIGYDPREAVAFEVLRHSIEARASRPVSIAGLRLSQLSRIHRRARDPLQSTDFAFTRFLVPALCGFRGWALFLDCDMLFRADVAALWALCDDRYAVQVVKHDHRPRESVKFLDQPQTPYARKNWSSVMLFNNARCRRLTPQAVEEQSGLWLHQFGWLDSEREIGALDGHWNHLVGYDDAVCDAKNVHYTLGGPYFWPTRDCEYAAEWLAEYEAMTGRPYVWKDRP